MQRPQTSGMGGHLWHANQQLISTFLIMSAALHVGGVPTCPWNHIVPAPRLPMAHNVLPAGREVMTSGNTDSPGWVSNGQGE